MKRRSTVAALTLLLSALVTAPATATPALAEPVTPAAGRTGFARVSAPLTRATGKVTAFVELAETPAVDTFNAEQANGADRDQASRAAQRSRERSNSQADKVVGALRDKDASTEEVAKTANAVAGVVVTADAAKLRELAAMPEVRAVRLSVPKVPQNASAVQLTKALKVWQQSGRFGDGMRVGVIDTGIDYRHADFGGGAFPTPKVVGGYDFAGDEYNANVPSKATPKPDRDPLDCQGHGTHVAGTAAGFGENADGSTFTGDYAKLTPEALAAMKIGPGTAPKALLYALKVFGCEGSSNLTTQALDWALDPNGDGDFADHLDVVNLSLGSDYAGQDDPDSLFVRKLTEHGVLVVASAGNGGDFYDVGGSPANTPEALAVANTRDAFALRDGAEVLGSGPLPGQYSKDFTGYDDLDRTAPVVAVGDQTNRDGCKPFSAGDQAAVAGKFVWLEWDDDDSTRACGSGGRTNNAQAAGAVGAILSSTKDNFAAGIAGNKTIPVFQFTRAATEQVRPALKAGTLRVRLTGALRNSAPTTTPTLADTITPSSSRGARGPVAAKPDVAAPGDTILSAALGTGDGAISMGGTSMASPHVAGIAALVRQVHPTWTPEEVKAAVMDTAGGTVTSGDDHTTGRTEAPMRVGAGRVDAKAAVDTTVLAMVEDDRGAVGVSFGSVEAAAPVARTRTVRIVNKGDQPQRLAISYQAVTSVAGVDFTPSAATVVVPAGGESKVEVRLRILDPAALRKSADPTVAKDQGGSARQYLAEASGHLVLTPSPSAPVLRVPVYAAPTPASDITAGDAGFVAGATETSLALYGRGVRQGAGDLAYRSLVSVFELQGSSDRLPDCAGSVKTGCAVNETAKGGDLRYVGASSTAWQGEQEDPLLAFGVATWSDWTTLGDNNTPEISIDTDGDGKEDFRTTVTKPSTAGDVTADVWLARTVTHGGEVVDEQPVNGQYGDVDTNVMDSDVVVLPVSLKALGIDAAKESTHRIAYTAGTSGMYAAPGNDGFIDRIAGTLSFDPLRPGLAARGGGKPALSYQAMPGSALVLRRDPAALALDGSDRLLVLHHHNATGKRAQVVTPWG
jgi:subtilisin family serine protease